MGQYREYSKSISAARKMLRFLLRVLIGCWEFDHDCFRPTFVLGRGAAKEDRPALRYTGKLSALGPNRAGNVKGMQDLGIARG